MMDALKKIDKKFLYIFGGIIALLVIFIIFAVFASMMSGPGKDYAGLETKLVEAAQKYVKDNKDSAPEIGEVIIVSSETLVSGGHLKELSKYVSDECTGQVIVMNNNKLLNYIPELNCTEYNTKKLAATILDENLVIESTNPYQSGLYEHDGEYIFKGKTPKNYVSFGGVTWRIIKIDRSGNLRLLKAEPEKQQVQWDTKYNLETKKSNGKNDYEFSSLLERLKSNYSGFKEENKRMLVRHDVCVGKREAKDYTQSVDIDCAEILENQYISTLYISEVSMASLDEDCNSARTGSCRNYNYMTGLVSSAWTTNAVKNNTYEIFTVSPGTIGRHEGNRRYNYFWVIYVSGQENFKSGSGTKDDPYIIR